MTRTETGLVSLGIGIGFLGAAGWVALLMWLR